jgi:hypothetical protein
MRQLGLSRGLPASSLGVVLDIVTSDDAVGIGPTLDQGFWLLLWAGVALLPFGALWLVEHLGTR